MKEGFPSCVGRRGRRKRVAGLGEKNKATGSDGTVGLELMDGRVWIYGWGWEVEGNGAKGR